MSATKYFLYTRNSLVTSPLEKSPFREAGSCSEGPEMSRLLWNPNIRCHGNRRPPLDTILGPHIMFLQDGLRIWRVAADMLSKQSRTADKGFLTIPCHKTDLLRNVIRSKN
jgi:hypothetical protein